jgi:hypothetical protein
VAALVNDFIADGACDKKRYRDFFEELDDAP